MENPAQFWVEINSEGLTTLRQHMSSTHRTDSLIGAGLDDAGHIELAYLRQLHLTDGRAMVLQFDVTE